MSQRAKSEKEKGICAGMRCKHGKPTMWIWSFATNHEICAMPHPMPDAKPGSTICDSTCGALRRWAEYVNMYSVDVIRMPQK
jgi:hypothetical protein